MKCPPLHILVFFLATEFLFMATILLLTVAKRRFFEKVSLERWCVEAKRKITHYRLNSFLLYRSANVGDLGTIFFLLRLNVECPLQRCASVLFVSSGTGIIIENT